MIRNRNGRLFVLLLSATIIVVVNTRPVSADYAAVSSGFWNDANTWVLTSSKAPGIPGATDTAYIGTYGYATNPTVTLNQDQSAASVTIGDRNTQGTLDLGNFNLSANNMTLGGGTIAPIQRGATGRLTISNSLQVGAANPFAFGAGDVSSNLSLYGPSVVVTTAATGNVTNSINIAYDDTLNLGANVNIASYFIIGLNGPTAPAIVNAAGHSITAASMSLYGPSILTGEAGLSVGTFGVFSNTNTIHGLNDTVNTLNIETASALTIAQATGQLTGFTLQGNTVFNLNILDTSVLNLQFAANSSANWIFRWADPTGSNWISTLNNDISSGRITITSPYGYSVYDQGGYTYIGSPGGVVPEPSSYLLFGLGALAVTITIRRTKSL